MGGIYGHGIDLVVVDEVLIALLVGRSHDFCSQSLNLFDRCGVLFLLLLLLFLIGCWYFAPALF